MQSRATTYAQLLARKAAGYQVLAQVGAFEMIQTWTAAGGGFTNTWKATIVQRQTVHNFRTITSVTSGNPNNNTSATIKALTKQTSIAAVDANLDSWYFDPSTSVLYVSVTPFSGLTDPNGFNILAGFTLYFSTGDPIVAGKTFVDDPTGNVYYPYICGAPSTDRSLADPFIGSITTGSGTLWLDAATAKLDAIWDTYRWEFGTVIVLFGGESLPLAEYATVFLGSSTQKSWTDDLIEFSLLDGADPLLADVSGSAFNAADFSNSVSYTGTAGSFSCSTTGQVGGIAVNLTQIATVGQLKPLTYGTWTSYTPVMVAYQTSNATNTAIVCVSDGAYHAVTGVKVGGTATGVTFSTCTTTGYVAVKLNTATAGAASSITAGITVDFASIEVSAGVIMDNPADIFQSLIGKLGGSVGTQSVVSSADSTAPVSFSYGGGSPPVPINTGQPTIVTSPATWSAPPSTSTTGSNTTPVGSPRPVTNGSFTNYAPQTWATVLSTPPGTPAHCSGFSTAGGFLNIFDAVNCFFYTGAIVCLGASYATISAVKINGSTTNVAWYVNPTSGLLLVIYIASTQNTAPITISTITVDFVAANATTTSPAGPVITIDTANLAASKTNCSNFQIQLSITQKAVIRDVLMSICRSTLSYVYLTNTGLLRFDTYTPSTSNETAMSEATGDFLTAPKVIADFSRSYRSISVEYGYNPAATPNYSTTTYTFANGIGAMCGRAVDYTVTQTLHTGVTGAAVLAFRLAKVNARGQPVYQVDTHPAYVALNLGDKVSISRARIPKATPTTLAHCFVSRIKRDLKNVKVTVELTENRISDLLSEWNTNAWNSRF